MESRHDVPRFVDAGEPLVYSTHSTGSTKSSTAGRTQARRPKFPPIDEHLVVPEETTEEIIKGRRVKIMPSEEEHAETDARLSFLITAHVRRGYIVASDLLSRFTWASDFATDVCVRKVGRDPQTGRRYLEELSFEIVNKQRIGNITDKADEMTVRGVRRIFAIFVRKNQIGEWSKQLGKFVMVNMDAMLDDPVLVRPVAFRSLLDSAVATQEVIRALALKKAPGIVAIRQKSERKGRKQGLDEGRKLGIDEGRKLGVDEGRKLGIDEGRKLGVDEGRKQGLDEGQFAARREALLEMLENKFGPVPARWKKRIHAANLEELRHFSRNLLTSSSIAGIFVTK